MARRLVIKNARAVKLTPGSFGTRKRKARKNRTRNCRNRKPCAANRKRAVNRKPKAKRNRGPERYTTGPKKGQFKKRR